MKRRGAWSTRFGIYMAAIGSAFGLGSLWRFPYIVEDNGGGAFVILYFFLLVLMGVPLLIGELLIGKVTRRGILGAQRQLVAQVKSADIKSEQRVLIRIMPWMAGFSLLAAVLILGYYSVVSGWVLHFLWEFTNILFKPDSAPNVVVTMANLQKSGMTQILWATVHLALVCFVVLKGVEDGIEKWIGLIMPVFVGILFVLVFKSLSMSSSTEALRFFLYPDFSKLNISSLGAAVGQLCFTLSIGFTTMVTFGSYLRDDAIVPGTGFRVATMDSFTALVAGLVIFPLVVSSSMDSRGPALLFETVPEFLMQFDGGRVFGVFFFICLYLAALGASISILEALVSNVCENSNLPRKHATYWVIALALLMSLFPALSSTLFAKFQIEDRGFLEMMDVILIHWLVPILALIFSQVVVYEVSDKMKRDEFMAMEGASSEILYSHWSFLMKWVIPPVIILALVLQTIDLFV